VHEGDGSARHGHSYGYKRGCDLCRSEAAQAKRELRARKRGLTSVPNRTHASDLPRAEPPSNANYGSDLVGPCVAAVHAELATLGDLTGHETLAAGAVAMARILDSGQNVPTWPAAAKQLMSAMNTLHKEAEPKRGTLAAIQAMSRHPSRPGAG
jgi:hypothetical protein